MAEFLLRGWNVAIPEVDTGDDIFVVQDENGTLRRVNDIGSKYEDYINLYFSYSDDKVECSGLDMSKHVGDYSDFPILEH